MLKRLIIFFVLLCSSRFSESQDKKISSKIESKNQYELSIIKIFPDSFPQITVFFQARNKLGEPLHLLKKGDFKVIENGYDCTEIIRVINISKDQPINIALVLDRSGSMAYIPNLTEDELDTFFNNYEPNMTLPNGWKMSLDFAKEGVLNFLKGIEKGKDSILFVSFSTMVDKVLPLSCNIEAVKEYTESIYPDGLTAFYDALYLSIDSLHQHSSKGVIVALTDGGDNSSTHSYQEVIEKAKEYNINLYVIGLGQFNDSILKLITNETKGFYYPTDDPDKLLEIYKQIKRQIKSVYQLDYFSQNFIDPDTLRQIKFEFLNDTLEFQNDSSFLQLPASAQNIIKERMQMSIINILESKNSSSLIWIIGSGGIAIGLSTFFFVLYRRKKRKFIDLIKISPNPFYDKVQVEYNSSENIENILLKVYNLNGEELISQKIQTGKNKIELDLLNYRNRFYIIKIVSDELESVAKKIMKR